jgi:DNA uptake protein ComE-like DNA-binding protein
MSGTQRRTRPRGGIRSAALLTLGILVLAGPTFGAAPGPAAAPAAAATPALAASPKPKPVAPIDINSASLAQLKTLYGIGDAEARRIIAHRPYLSKADLVTKNVIPAGIYQSNRHRIIAVQKGTPRPGKHP